MFSNLLFFSFDLSISILIIIHTVMDNCFPNPCQNSGTCYDEGMDYTCTCTGDWLGQRCTDSKCCQSRYHILKW